MGYSIFDETMVDMTWPEIEKAIKNQAVVLFPLGVIEEHGPHLGLAVDIYTSYLLARMVKHELEPEGIPALIAPPFYWGINVLTGAFPGSFTVRPETLKAVLLDSLASLKNWGVNYVFTFNWHGEFKHCEVILEAVKEARAAKGLKSYCLISTEEARRFKLTGSEEYIALYSESSMPGASSPYLDLHAGSLETAVMLKYFPEKLDPEKIKSLPATQFTFNDLKKLGKGGSETRRTLTSGYFGNPAGFDLAAAQSYIESEVHHYSRLIENIIRGTYQPPKIS
jgi:creatinine amidohydrolase